MKRNLVTILVFVGLIPWLGFAQDSAIVKSDFFANHVALYNVYVRDCSVDTIRQTCPSCGKQEQLDEGEDAYFIKCYGRWYWERNYYPPNALRQIWICKNCGTVYIPRKHVPTLTGFIEWMRAKISP